MSIKDEVQKALAEAKRLIKKYKLKGMTVVGFHPKMTIENLDRIVLVSALDTRLILNVTKETFVLLVDSFEPEYVYRWSYPNDNSGGYGLQKVWFITNSKLRIVTDSHPADGGFMDNAILPSENAQSAKLRARIGGRSVSLEDAHSICRELGFLVYDPISRDEVNKIKLLSPNKLLSLRAAALS